MNTNFDFNWTLIAFVFVCTTLMLFLNNFGNGEHAHAVVIVHIVIILLTVWVMTYWFRPPYRSSLYLYFGVCFIPARVVSALLSKWLVKKPESE